MTKRLRRHFTCPAEFAFYVLGGKWRGAVVAHLSSRPMRYSDLRRAIPQISDKVLVATLKELEHLGIGIKAASENASSDIRIYRLTARGQALAPMLRLACAWARVHAADYGVDFLHGPPCAPNALKVELKSIVAETISQQTLTGPL